MLPRSCMGSGRFKKGKMDLLRNVTDIASELRSNPLHSRLSAYESLMIAVEIQRNELYCQANVVNTIPGTPSALEKIAMELHSMVSQVALT